MNTTKGILDQMINQVNLKLAKMEKGYYIELNGCILDLVKGNERYCLLIEGETHAMFTYLMHIDHFIYALVGLYESAVLKEMGEKHAKE